MFKVKSHTSEEDVAKGIITHENRRGNGLADKWAIHAAAQVQLDPNTIRKVMEADSFSGTGGGTGQNDVVVTVSYDRTVKLWAPQSMSDDAIQ